MHSKLHTVLLLLLCGATYIAITCVGTGLCQWKHSFTKAIKIATNVSSYTALPFSANFMVTMMKRSCSFVFCSCCQQQLHPYPNRISTTRTTSSGSPTPSVFISRNQCGLTGWFGTSHSDQCTGEVCSPTGSNCGLA